MNDIVDLTDQFNELLEAYAVSGGIVDLDSWSSYDLNTLANVAEQALQIRGEERTPNERFDMNLAGEYDESGIPLE